MSVKRVLHVIQALTPKLGGSVRALLDLSQWQSLSGLEVEVCTTNIDVPNGIMDVPTDRFVEANGVRFWYFPAQHRPLLYSRQLKRHLDSTIASYDIVHIHGLYRFPTTYAAYCSRRRRVPYIVRPHGSLDPFLYRHSSRSLILKRLYERWFDFPNLQAADAIHYTSEDERERASFLKLRTPTFVVPNGIDWSRFETLPRRGRFRTRLGIGQAPLILFLGRINFKKGLDLLIRAFDVLRPSIPDARLAIVGPDNEGYGEKVRHWIEERDLREQVDIVDHLNELEALEAFVDADAFVLPSYTENFGITVIEAMACETPVVISDQVNIHREVTSLGAGVVTRCDVDEIARALSDLLSHPEKGRQMGTAGRRAAKNRYTWGPVVEALKEQYEAVASRTRSKY